VTAIDNIASIYRRGVDSGDFRPGLDPLELHWQVSALCFFNVSNRATFSNIFGRDMGTPNEQAKLRENTVEMVLRFVSRLRTNWPLGGVSAAGSSRSSVDPHRDLERSSIENRYCAKRLVSSGSPPLGLAGRAGLPRQGRTADHTADASAERQ
jgi:hypothetical protein